MLVTNGDDYPFSSSVRIDMIPTFDGTNMEYDEWISQMEAAMALSKTQFSDDEGCAKLMRWRLRGQAIGVYDQLPERVKSSFEELKKEMSKHYNTESTKRMRMMEFQTIKQKEYEKAADFAVRFHHAARRALDGKPDMEERMLEEFPQRLYNKDLYIRVMGSRPTTFRGAVESATFWEQVAIVATVFDERDRKSKAQAFALNATTPQQQSKSEERKSNSESPKNVSNSPNEYGPNRNLRQ
jgi:hypothetical protein